MSEPARIPRPSRRDGGKSERRESADSLTVACFGELLWDCLPRGLFLGGAPTNAAYHLSQHGMNVLSITAVGRDFLGEEALRRMGAWGLDLKFGGRERRWPTGTVRATLDAKGVASYEITRAVAWDHISAPEALRRRAPAALVHGTLALRAKPNRRALAQLLESWPHTLRVVDLNFRQPFATRAVTEFALRSAQLVKLNDEELATLTGVTGKTSAALAKAARVFASRHRIERVCVTAGARGAGLWWDEEWHWEPARPVNVRDTIGAGDAFLGGLLGALLVRQAKPAEALSRACRMGEFVAARDGATPAYQLDSDGRPVEPSAVN